MEKKTIEQRFWEKVKKSTDEECWLWGASTTGNNGYGYFRTSKELGHQTAHRYSYELHCGSIPKGMLVCHTCDNPLCVNPTHLFLGTHQDNAIDREKKSRCKTHGLQVLNDKTAKEIKYSTLSQSKLSKIYGVSRTTVANIQKGKAWKHIL